MIGQILYISTLNTYTLVIIYLSLHTQLQADEPTSTSPRSISQKNVYIVQLKYFLVKPSIFSLTCLLILEVIET